MTTTCTDGAARGRCRAGAGGIIRHRPGGRDARHGAGAALLTLLVLLGGCAAPAVEVALVGLTPEPSTLLEPRLRVDFRLQNFSQRQLEATGVALTLDVNGRRLASGVDATGFRLDPLGEARVSAVVSTSLFEVARQLLTLADREEFSYELRGRVHLDGWPRSLGFRRGGAISRAELERLAGTRGREPATLRLD